MPSIGAMEPRHTDEDALIPIGEAARFLGVSVDTMRRWDKQGKLVAIRTVGGTRRYRRAEIEALVGAA